VAGAGRFDADPSVVPAMRVRMRETSVLLITFVCFAHPLGVRFDYYARPILRGSRSTGNLSDRNRGDLKFVNSLFTPIYRNRLQLEKPLRTGRIGLIPYASAEAFYDTRYDQFNQFHFTAGMEWILAAFPG
jgi:hypothetical protein